MEEGRKEGRKEGRTETVLGSIFDRCSTILEPFWDRSGTPNPSNQPNKPTNLKGEFWSQVGWATAWDPIDWKVNPSNQNLQSPTSFELGRIHKNHMRRPQIAQVPGLTFG